MWHKIQTINTGLICTCVIGFILSSYTYIIEVKAEMDDEYQAMCDINEYISCTKAFKSEYGKGFGIIPKDCPIYFPNCVYGLFYYTLIGILSAANKRINALIVLVLALLSNIATIYLAYILYLLKDICVVCISTYLINAIILFLGWKKMKIVFPRGKLHEN